MAHDPLFFQLQDIIIHAVFLIGFPVGKLVLAMDKTVINIIGTQLL